MRPLQNCDPATAREAIDIGCRELRTMFIAVCRESGHDVCGPSGVVDQSCALTRSPIVEDGELSGAPTMPSSTANPAATLCHDYTFVRNRAGNRPFQSFESARRARFMSAGAAIIRKSELLLSPARNRAA